LAGIYIHIPFCRQACIYCNFHFSTSPSQKTILIDAINREISITEIYNEPEKTINTIYFGGGTPSMIDERDLNSIFNSIHKKFPVANDAEITLEANPDNINPFSLSSWKQMGINRLSVGIQSFIDEELKWMNRAHTAAESMKCLDDIVHAGIQNYSVDLIYGSPLLSNDDFKNNVEIILNKNIPHVSCYALTVESKTVLAEMIRQKKTWVDENKQAEQFLLLMQWMGSGGYEQYEISNFSKPMMRSRHNSNYWHGVPYYGIGPSAHSFDGKNMRRWNVANNSLYVQSLNNDLIPFTEEQLTKTQQQNEYTMISLRTIEGLDLTRATDNFGKNFKNGIWKECMKHVTAGNIQMNNNILTLTPKGKLMADGIAADLFSNEFNDVVKV